MPSSQYALFPDTLRGLAEGLRGRLASVPGLVDLSVERQVLIPQIKVRVDYRKAAQYGWPLWQ